MATHTHRRAEIFIRSYTPTSEPQNSVIERARAQRATGRFDEVSIEDVPSAVRRSGEPTAVERRYEAFRAWAADAGYDVSRPFRVRETKNRITGETVEKLVLPIVSLAVYEDDALVAVLPCEGPDGHWSVLDYLGALEAGNDPLGTLGVDGRRPRLPLAP